MDIASFDDEIAKKLIQLEEENKRLKIEKSAIEGLSILDSSVDAIICFDEDGIIDVYSRAAEDIFDYRKAEILGKNIDVLLPFTGEINDVQLFPANVKFNLRSIVGKGRELFGKKKNGIIFPMDASVGVSQHNGLTRYTAIFRDITKIKQTEEQLSETSERFKELAENLVKQVFWIVDFTEKGPAVCYVSPSYERIFNYPIDPLYKNTFNWLNPVHPDDKAKVKYEFLKNAMRGKYDVTFRYFGEDGEVKWFRDRGYSIRKKKNNSFRVVGIGEDITEQKELINQLNETKNEAENANKTKSAFLANMSHEIRTPMNGIVGMAELACQTSLSEEQYDYIDTIRTSANALLKILNDIIDFSKIEAGKLELENVDFDVNEVVDNAVRLFALNAEEKKLELIQDVDTSIKSMLKGDSLRIRQVLINLLGNAIKFTKSGEIIVSVNVLEENDRNVTVKFAVSDTGGGIPIEKQKTIFEAFSQADTSITRKFGGTGLGLAITVQLVEMMGGKVQLESVVGMGTTFSFNLTFEKSNTVIEKAYKADITSLSGLNALVVDDNETNRKIINKILESWKVKPTLVSNAKDALRMLKNSNGSSGFDIVLLDAHMPEMDGFTLAEKISTNNKINVDTLIMISSSDQKTKADICRDYGFKDVLIKPITQKELRDSLLKCIGLVSKAEKNLQPINKEKDIKEELQNLTILLAEDNPVNQKVASKMLEKQGFQVEVAGDGYTAFDMWQAKDFDLILMDIQMPGISGYEVTEKIRQDEGVSGKHTPIIALTAHAMKDDRDKCIAHGMDDYISKPIKYDDLRHVIHKLMTQY